jgi:hypothetical protein
MGKVYEDDTDEEVANRSEDSQAIMNEAKGDTMLKAMRDEAAKPKAKVVTKEELSKSGLSLRDYMNKQQGLSRRVGNTAPKAETVKPATDMSMKDRITKEAIDSIKASGKKYPDMSVLQAPAKRAGMTAMEPRRMAKGGSASARADGIAQRGKTRGKMIMCGGGYAKGKK